MCTEQPVRLVNQMSSETDCTITNLFAFTWKGTTLSLFVCKELLLVTMHIHCTTALGWATTDTPGFKPCCSAVFAIFTFNIVITKLDKNSSIFHSFTGSVDKFLKPFMSLVSADKKSAH